MRSLKILTSKDEKLVNSLIRDKKTSSFIFLYHSEWDKWSSAVLELAKAWSEKDGNETCYVISSWELPHAFAAFGISNSPSIVEVANGNLKVFVEYPRVYDFFSPKKK